MRETFLCATDATPSSGPALRFALKLAKASAASLLVVHVVEAPPKRGGLASPSQRKMQKQLAERRLLAAKQRLQLQLNEARGPRAGVPVEVVVRAGAVTDAVIELVLAKDVSLVVLGKGRTAGAIAPAAQELARALSRPVVLVPGRRARRASVRVLYPAAKPRRRTAPAARAS
ncbi:MAG: universal stress protein [Polyangiaceae bacterium]|nr:universal stress protein [Polyangiaceae bacterium]